MWTFFTLELKGIIKEYRHSFSLSINKVIFLLLLIMSMTLIFFILHLLKVNIFHILNVFILFTFFVAISFKKDLFLEYILNGKSFLIEIFPRNKLYILIVKGIKYEIIVLFEMGFIQLTFMIPLILSGYHFKQILGYFIFSCLLFLSIRNIVSILNHNKIITSISVFVLVLKSGLLGIGFIIISIVTTELTKFLNGEGTVASAIFDNSLISKGLEILETNLINWKTVIIFFLIMITTYLFKIVIFSAFKNTTYNITSTLLNSKSFKRYLGNVDPILLKEYALLVDTGILLKMLERVIMYIIATIMILLVQNSFRINFSENTSLFLIIMLSEVSVLMGSYSKSAIGHEGKFIINYILSDLSVSDLIVKKAKLAFIITSIIAFIIYSLVSFIFHVSFQLYLSYIPILVTFILMYTYAVNYFNTFNTSFFNRFMIPHKYASLKIIGLSSFVGYVDITVILIVFITVTEEISIILSPILISFLHLVIFLLFKLGIISKRKCFYGEYSSSVSEK